MSEYERRHSERDDYATLRALARLQGLTGYASLGLGILGAAVVVAFAGLPGPAKLAATLILLLAGWFGYFLLRAQAQMIYILFDIARNTRLSRELLERPSAH
jgi:hypothetical protein